MQKLLVSVLIVIILLLIAAVGAYFYIMHQIETPVAVAGEKQSVTVEKGLGIKEIAAQLEEENLIRGALYFETYVWLKGIINLQAGDYEISSTMSIPEIVQIISGGYISRNEIKVTIPEGFTVKQIDESLAKAGLIEAGELVNFKSATSHLPLATSLEGYLFPDTYIFNENASLEDIVGKFINNFYRKINPEMKEQIEAQGKTLQEVIILASIVQQEAVSNDEMPKVAGVFQNRLDINMGLQSDATVNYITGKGMRQPLYSDTDIDSPYNTYKYRGLPPGPICNSGIDAIKAAISPEKHDYYFFLHPLDAPTVFSRTLDEHNTNKAKWLQ